MNKTWFYNNFVFRLVSPLILGVVVYMLVLLFFDSIEQFTSNFFGQEVAFVIILSFFFLELNRLIIILLNRIQLPEFSTHEGIKSKTIRLGPLNFPGFD